MNNPYQGVGYYTGLIQAMSGQLRGEAERDRIRAMQEQLRQQAELKRQQLAAAAEQQAWSRQLLEKRFAADQAWKGKLQDRWESDRSFDWFKSLKGGSRSASGVRGMTPGQQIKYKQDRANAMLQKSDIERRLKYVESLSPKTTKGRMIDDGGLFGFANYEQVEAPMKINGFDEEITRSDALDVLREKIDAINEVYGDPKPTTLKKKVEESISTAPVDPDQELLAELNALAPGAVNVPEGVPVIRSDPRYEGFTGWQRKNREWVWEQLGKALPMPKYLGKKRL